MYKRQLPLPRQGGILRPALVVFAALSLVTGLAYPFLTTGIAAAVFPHEASGSLIRQGDKVVGSEWIGQSFSAPQYFWGRPSATSPMPYNGANSGGSNLGPRNPALAEAVQARIAALKEMCIRDSGKGYGSEGLEPVLKDKARTWLVQKTEVLAFSEAPEREGGAGALLVLLRQSEGPRK